MRYANGSARCFAGDQHGRAAGEAQMENAEQDENGRGSEGYGLKESQKELAQIHEMDYGAKRG